MGRAKRGASEEFSMKSTSAFESITAKISEFCRAHLNAEYEAVCLELAAVLASEQPSLLSSGKPEGWAAGIVRAIGMVNFLHDPSQDPHLRSSDIDQGSASRSPPARRNPS